MRVFLLWAPVLSSYYIFVGALKLSVMVLQTGFFRGVVIPIYDKVASIFPGAKSVLIQATKNCAHWEAAAAAVAAARGKSG